MESALNKYPDPPQQEQEKTRQIIINHVDLTNFRLKEDKIAELEKSQEAFKDVEILEKRIVESMQRD